MRSLFVFILLILSLSSAFAEKGWIEKHYVKNDDITQLKIDKNNNCIALLNNTGYTKIYKSSDYGESWETIYEQYHFSPLDSVWTMDRAEIYDTRHFYLGYNGYNTGIIVMDMSTDGGVTFTRKTFPDLIKREGNKISDIKMFNSNLGVICTDDQLIFTSDNWASHNIIPKGEYKYAREPIFFIDSNNIALKFNKHDFVAYDIVGNQWYNYCTLDTIGEYKYKKNLYDAYFISDTIAFACGGQQYGSGEATSDIIWKTTDKGRHWKIIFENTILHTFAPTKIFFKNDSLGIAVGGWGKIMETMDSGKTWNYLSGNEIIDNSIGCRVIIVNGYPIISARGHIFRYEEVSSSIEEAPEAFRVYPIPAPSGGALHIALGTQLAGTADISIYDLRGTRISTLFTGELSTADITVSLPALPSGPYFIAVTTPQGVHKRKVVVE